MSSYFFTPFEPNQPDVYISPPGGSPSSSGPGGLSGGPPIGTGVLEPVGTPFDPSLTQRSFTAPSTPPASRDIYGGSMPSDLTSARGSLLGSLIQGGLNVLGSFLPPPTLPGQGADYCKEHPFDIGCVIGNATQPFIQQTAGAASTAMVSCRSGLPYRQPAQCYVQSKTGKKFRGSYKVVNGQVVCCPRRRAMNPMNGRAAIRAARRLKGVFKFQRRVEKALQKACRGSGVRRRGSTRGRSCKKCT